MYIIAWYILEVELAGFTDGLAVDCRIKEGQDCPLGFYPEHLGGGAIFQNRCDLGEVNDNQSVVHFCSCYFCLLGGQWRHLLKVWIFKSGIQRRSLASWYSTWV